MIHCVSSKGGEGVREGAGGHPIRQMRSLIWPRVFTEDPGRKVEEVEGGGGSGSDTEEYISCRGSGGGGSSHKGATQSVARRVWPRLRGAFLAMEKRKMFGHGLRGRLEPPSSLLLLLPPAIVFALSTGQ